MHSICSQLGVSGWGSHMQTRPQTLMQAHGPTRCHFRCWAYPFGPSKMRKAYCSLQPTIISQRLSVDLNTALSLQKPGFVSGFCYCSYLKRGAPANFKGCSVEGKVGHRLRLFNSTSTKIASSVTLTLHLSETWMMWMKASQQSRSLAREQVTCFALHSFSPIFLSFSCKTVPCFLII